jgi:hypothetical protein
MTTQDQKKQESFQPGSPVAYARMYLFTINQIIF